MQQIRIPVVYQTAERVVSEYTTAVSKGGCLVVAKQAMSPGTRFLFELFLTGDTEPLQLNGEVVRVRKLETDDDSYEMAIQYLAVGVQLARIATLVRTISVDESHALVRRYPRVPINLIALDEYRGVRYLIRDISASGIRVEGRDVFRAVDVGRKVLLSVMVSLRSVAVEIPGTVVWVERGTRALRTRLGVSFDPEVLSQTSMVRGSLTPSIVLDGLINLLRPAHVGLSFVAEPSDLMRSSAIRRVVRVIEGVKTIAAVIAHAQIRHLISTTNLGLGAASRKVGVLPSMVCARVQLVGDFEGELVLYASVELAQYIADSIAGEAVPGAAAVVDALVEFATTVAGAVCDAVDSQGIDIEVTAPILGDRPDIFGEQAITAEMVGPHGTLLASILAVARSPSEWPG